MSKTVATQKLDDKVHAAKAKKREDATRPTANALAHPTLSVMQNHLGNAAVQRLLAQRSGASPTELDDVTAVRINTSRGNGQALDGAVQTQMGAALGADFSGVRVHTSGESHTLNEQLGARAFTTGQDIFFRDGEYNPNSSSGKELLAHELTHVVQQGSGAVQSGGRMAVNAPGDRFEQEADVVAKNVSGSQAAPAVQRQLTEEDELQTKLAQRQELDEEEVQLQELPEDEEEVQRQAVDDEELMTE